MADPRLIRADATKLDELRGILAQQKGAEKLRPIEMKDIFIGHGAISHVTDAVRSLTPGTKILMVTGPTKIMSGGKNVKEEVFALLKKDFDVERLTITEGEGKLIHTTPENSEKIEARLGGVSCVVGVGSGTLCDLCKRATFHINEEHPLPLVIVQTALSVNAFSDGVSVMLINGVKRTIHSHYPSILIVDLDIIADAPAEMNVSGYGDLIATWTAPVDWYLANVLGMGDNFHTAPSDMIRVQCEELLENSGRLKAGDPKVIGDLANVLTLSGLSMGIAGESCPASGSEHVMSHLIDMASGVRHTGICYHGTQVAVSGIISSIIWDYFLNEFDPSSVDLDKAYPDAAVMEGRVKEAFDWLDNDHSAANECWADYRIKLARWHAHKDELKDFLAHFDEFRDQVSGWVKKPEYISACMHSAGAPTRYSELNYPVDAKTVRWAINNCCLMRNRFSVIDLLYFSGIWDAKFVDMLLERAEKLDAGL
jgi:glycerol-1-phosphate dehydrogenase [NAD(P)+]